jgi:hypothetical protein
LSAANQAAGQTYALDIQTRLAQQAESNDRLHFFKPFSNDDEDTSLIFQSANLSRHSISMLLFAPFYPLFTCVDLWTWR